MKVTIDLKYILEEEGLQFMTDNGAEQLKQIVEEKIHKYVASCIYNWAFENDIFMKVVK